MEICAPLWSLEAWSTHEPSLLTQGKGTLSHVQPACSRAVNHASRLLECGKIMAAFGFLGGWKAAEPWPSKVADIEDISNSTALVSLLKGQYPSPLPSPPHPTPPPHPQQCHTVIFVYGCIRYISDNCNGGFFPVSATFKQKIWEKKLFWFFKLGSSSHSDSGTHLLICGLVAVHWLHPLSHTLFMGGSLFDMANCIIRHCLTGISLPISRWC